MKKLITCFLILFGLSGCKMDFVGDLYISDLISVARSGEEIYSPMEMSFQVSSCNEDLTSINNKIGSYFKDYKVIGCGTKDDFMSYISAKISVPITNDLKNFNSQNKDLIGFWSKFSEDGKFTDVYLIVNRKKLDNLNDYVEKQTFQRMSLAEGKLRVNVSNDMNKLTIKVYPSVVDGNPLVQVTDFELDKREKITIDSSNVSAMHLQKNGWSPIFFIKNLSLQ